MPWLLFQPGDVKVREITGDSVFFPSLFCTSCYAVTMRKDASQKAIFNFALKKKKKKRKAKLQGFLGAGYKKCRKITTKKTIIRFV